MKNGNLFHHEEEVIKNARALIEQARPEEYEQLLAEYEKLCRQVKSLVNISDLMQKDLNQLNEEVHQAHSDLELKNNQLMDLSGQLALALEQSEKQYQGFFQNAVEGIFRISPSGMIATANPAMAVTFGFSSPQELAAQSREVRDYFVNSNEQEALYAELESSGRVSERRVTLRKKNGKPFRASITAWAVKGDDGAVQYYEGVLADVTEREEVEEAQREREAAEAASQAKSRFLAKMSHEIRTPLNAILGMTEIVLRTDLTPDQREHLETVRDAGDHLLDIINDVLDFSKLEARRLQLDQADFDLNRVLESTLNTLSVSARQKKLNLSLHIDPKTPLALHGDPGRLRQVLVNLMGNAIKFTEKGSVAVSVAPGTVSETTIELHFSVADTGIGISEEHQQDIFKDFTQSDLSIYRKYGGTGLGLSIARDIIHMMGGDISVRSEPDHGSTFSFTAVFLPAMDKPTLHQAPAPQQKKAPMQVLVVEDNPVNAKVVELLLKDMGHSAVTVASGEEALEQLNQNLETDLVLMDLEMPGMDGLEATRRMRQLKGTYLPIAAMTAHAFHEVQRDCLAAGMDDFITKPIKNDELANLLQRVADRNAKPEAEEDETSGAPVLDSDRARREMGLSAEDFHQCFNLAVGELATEMRRMGSAATGQETARLAHSLKTTAGHMGAYEMRAAAINLEQAAKVNDAISMSKNLDKLKESYVRLLAAVQHSEGNENA